MREETVKRGFGIVVLDRGFVYVGDVTISGDWCKIANARNIRTWGTEGGLGQLALEGPTTSETVLDDVGTVHAPLRAVISVIDSEVELWKKSSS